MKISQHIISSLPLAGVYYLITKNLPAAFLVVISTIAVDIDHVLDYVITQKRIDSIKKMTKAFETFDIVHKNYLLLHSWEALVLFAVCLFFFPNPYLIAIFTGYMFHLLCDQVFNSHFLGKYNTKSLFYFFLYRLHMNFDVLPMRKG